jgi:perosamine synthetase
MPDLRKYINKINANLISGEAYKEVEKVLKSGVLSQPHGGGYVKKLQLSMAKLTGSVYGYATTSGTSSLHAAVAVLNLKPGDEVMVPAWTFMADASVVLQERATPVFVDVSPDDFNIDPADVLKKLTTKTKAIIVVHMFGQPAQMDKLRDIAKRNKLVLIEDAAQAFGATFNGKFVGGLGDIGVFSFFQTKQLVSGEGGMILVNNGKYLKDLDSFLNNGIINAKLDEYNFDRVGFNYQMTEIAAAILLTQLKRFKKLIKLRRKYAEIYKKILNKTGIHFQTEWEDTSNSYCFLTGLVPREAMEKRDLLVEKALKSGVPIKKQYPLALTETDLVKSLYGDLTSKTPVSLDCARRVVNFYVNPELSVADITFFARKFLEIYKSVILP